MFHRSRPSAQGFELAVLYQLHYAEGAVASPGRNSSPIIGPGQFARNPARGTPRSYDAKTATRVFRSHICQEAGAYLHLQQSLRSGGARLRLRHRPITRTCFAFGSAVWRFLNGAQVIIDQFIVSAESKWQRPSGIVLLLPHGYEGQGPEHSSARLERFLQACAEDNIQVCNLTTSAQYFHVLRRQMKRNFVKPLIIMTPKSLLRAEFASSRAEEFTGGGFEEILGSPSAAPAEKMERIIFCSGKVYYDLFNYRAEKKVDTAAIVRIEQLYPFAEKAAHAMVKPYSKTAKVVWCQEESQNMGAWTFIEPRLRKLFGRDIAYAGRKPSASLAVGALAIHKREQTHLIAEAFSI